MGKDINVWSKNGVVSEPSIFTNSGYSESNISQRSKRNHFTDDRKQLKTQINTPSNDRK